MSIDIGGTSVSLDETELVIKPFDGPIPRRIGRLSNLEVLELSGNLTGELITEIFTLNKLVRLTLVPDDLHEGLSGSIPKEVGRLANLEELDLRENGLSSSIPSHIGRLQELSSLRLFENLLTGPMPTELGNLRKLNRLNLRNNELSGQMPSELGNLVLLTQMRLYINKLTGTIPEEHGRLQLLTRLVLEGPEQSIGGTIPTTLGDLQNLERLNLADNSFVGTIPDELGRLDRLQQLLLGGNDLNGTVKSEIVRLPELGVLGLAENSFDEIEELSSTSLTSLDLAGNGFDDLPDFVLPGLFEVFLDGNNLKELPRGLNNSASIEILHWSETNLGSFPNEILQMSNLQELILTDANIAGPLPSLKHLDNLFLLDLSRNRITQVGELPGFLGQLFLEGNEISGTLSSFAPTELSRLEVTQNKLFGNLSVVATMFGLENFQGGDNQFTGPLPDLSGTGIQVFAAPNNMLSGMLEGFLTASSTLEAVDLTNNQLNGPIPPAVGSMLLTELRLQSNQLEGAIPEELWDLSGLRLLTLAGNNLEGELSQSITELQDGLAVLSLGLEVTCDCHFLAWYPDFVQGSAFNERDKIAECSAVNEYHGVYAHLLRSEVRAPCSHPAFNSSSLSDEPRSAVVELFYVEDYNATKVSVFSEIGWTLREPTTAMEFGSENAALFEQCSLFKTPATFEGTVVSGFELQWHPPGQPEDVRKLCSLGSTIMIDGLSPFSNYSVFGRAFLLYFSESTDDTEISYVYGPQSAAFRVQTKPSPPDGYVKNLRVFEREAKRLEFIWDEVPKAEQNGEIIDYKVSVIGEATNLEEFVISQFATVDELEPTREYRVIITARNSEGLGPPSPSLPISTCEINGKWNRSEGSDRCFAASGYYEVSEGLFTSCADLTRHYPALEDAFCVDDNTTVDRLPVRDEFWRESLFTSEIVPCPRGEFCHPSGVNLTFGRPDDVNAYCSEHHTGIYCFSCEDGFVPTDTGCVECNRDLERNAALTLFCGILLLLVFLLMLWARILYFAKILSLPRCLRWAAPANDNDESGSNLTLKGTSSGPIQGSMLRKGMTSTPRSLRTGQSWARAAASVSNMTKYTSRFSTFTKMRILFGFWQVFFSYQRSFQHHTINNPFSAVADGVSSMSISVILNRFQTRCAMDHNHYHVLLFETLMPPVLMLILAGLCVWASHCTQTDSQRNRLYEEFMWSVFLLLFLVYPSVSQTIMETFSCQTWNVTDLDVPEHVLRNDFRTDCSASPERTWWVFYAVMMVLAYPVGVIVLYGVNLRTFRKLVTKREKGVAQLKKLTRISFLIYPYKPNIYWYETYELLRKLIQTSFIGLLPLPSAELQGTLALIAQNVTVVALIVLVYLKPYRKLSDFMFAVISLLLLLPAAQLSILDPFARAETDLPLSVLGMILLIEFLFFLVFCTWDVASGMYGDEFWCYKQQCYKMNSTFYEPNNYGASELVNAGAAKREMQKVLVESRKVKLENAALRKALGEYGKSSSDIDVGNMGDADGPQTRTQILKDDDQMKHEIVDENENGSVAGSLAPLSLSTSPRTVGTLGDQPAIRLVDEDAEDEAKEPARSQQTSESSIELANAKDMAVV